MSPLARRLYEGRLKTGKMGGVRKGTKSQKVQAREAVQKEVSKLIMSKALTLVRAGMIPALGQNFIYRIDEETNEAGKVLSRKHVLVTDPDEIAEALDQMEEGGTHPDDKYYYVTAKEPDHKAIEMLFNRAFGKPKESVDVNVKAPFSLKQLGKRTDELRKIQATDVTYETVEPVAIAEENTGSIVPPA